MQIIFFHTFTPNKLELPLPTFTPLLFIFLNEGSVI